MHYKHLGAVKHYRKTVKIKAKNVFLRILRARINVSPTIFRPLLSLCYYLGQTKDRRVLAKGQRTPETHKEAPQMEETLVRGRPASLYYSHLP